MKVLFRLITSSFIFALINAGCVTAGFPQDKSMLLSGLMGVLFFLFTGKKSVSETKSVKDIENIVLTSRKGVPLLIKDVAQVDIGNMPPSGVLGLGIQDLSINSPKSVQGLVLMRRGENPSQVLEELQKHIVKINESLPKDVKFEENHLKKIYNILLRSRLYNKRKHFYTQSSLFQIQDDFS